MMINIYYIAQYYAKPNIELFFFCLNFEKYLTSILIATERVPMNNLFNILVDYASATENACSVEILQF